ncbi:MAG TPA: SUMF1/EgtB/PvdO family nonheme iron enzyme [Polyangiaceae bacterium]|nr:SUMF1/EgtB/PvdO family nonheme iron enzyme [Polyangiaceae bacterium]
MPSEAGAAGNDDTSDFAQSGKLGLGGRAIVSKPQIGGASVSNVGGESSVEATGGAASSESLAGAPTEAGAPAVVAGGGGKCPDLGGEKLVQADGFCIDESEVTFAHYQAFVDSHPSVASQPAVCAGNTTFANGCKATEPAKQPARCVDWCDARAYCQSVGKHLCGSTGSASGALPYDAAVISTDNQWYAACSHAGERTYPYGDSYDTSACWSADRPPVGNLIVKSASGCVGGYEGLWDMSGGLAEWIDSCNGEKGMADACHIRGGSFSGSSAELRCDWESGAARDTSSNYIGFRCCADLTR